MIFYLYFFCLYYNISYVQATIYIKAPNSVSSHQVQNLMLKFINPLRGIRGLPNSKVEVEVPLDPHSAFTASKNRRISRPESQQEDVLEEDNEDLRDGVKAYRRENVDDNKDVKTASKTTTIASTVATERSAKKSDLNDEIIRMKQLRKELLALEMRLATGNRLIHNDDVRTALKELEKKLMRESDKNGTDICDEEILLDEAMQPAQLEDLWKVLGQKFHNITELGCSNHKKRKTLSNNEVTTPENKKTGKSKSTKSATSESDNSDNKVEEDINSDSDNSERETNGGSNIIGNLLELIKFLQQDNNIDKLSRKPRKKNKQTKAERITKQDLSRMKLNIPVGPRQFLQ